MKIENKNCFGNTVNLHKQHGASLLEGIAYLGIAALVVLGAVSLLSSASASAKANQTNQELIALRTAVRKLYAGQSYPTSNPTSLLPVLTSAKAIPSTLQVNNGAVTNSWGQSVTVDGTTTTSFTIKYAGLPQDVCVSVLSGASDWKSIKQGTGTAITTFPLTSQEATTICSGDTNDISFESL
jgi:type II secretory pathway pseudopilin PulG